MPNWYSTINPQFVRNVSQAYIQDGAFEVFSMFPKLDVRRKTDYIAVYTKSDWLKIGNVGDYKRTGATESIGDDYTVTKTQYITEQIAFHKDVTREEAENFDSPIDAVKDATKFVMNRIKRVALKQLSSTVFTTGVWGTDADLTSAKWSGSVDPVAKVMEWHNAITKATGYQANRMIMTNDVLAALKTNQKIIDRMKTSSDKVLTVDLIAKLFEVDSIFVLSVVNEAGDDYMIKGKVLLYYAPNEPSRFEPSAAYFIVYRGEDGTNVTPRVIPMPHLNDAVRIEVSLDMTLKVVGADLAVYGYNVV